MRRKGPLSTGLEPVDGCRVLMTCQNGAPMTIITMIIGLLLRCALQEKGTGQIEQTRLELGRTETTQRTGKHRQAMQQGELLKGIDDRLE